MPRVYKDSQQVHVITSQPLIFGYFHREQTWPQASWYNSLGFLSCIIYAIAINIHITAIPVVIFAVNIAVICHDDPATSINADYRWTSNISRTLLGNIIVDQSDVVGASPVGAAATTSSFPTSHLAPTNWTKTTARRDEKHLIVRIWCLLYQMLNGNHDTCSPCGILLTLIMLIYFDFKYVYDTHAFIKFLR